jgi:hypothetical protein
MFNTTKYFHCYDPCCFLFIMALMCGCVVVQHPVEGYSEEEWRYTIGIGDLPGIAYGYDKIQKAEETIGEAYAKCVEFLNNMDKTIDRFVHEIETGTYDTKECYRFTESPYSLLHENC